MLRLAPSEQIEGAVAALLRYHRSTPDVLLMVRAANPRDRWSGQVSFPGGREERGDDSLRDAITASVQTILKLRGDVELVQPGSLPNDGKVIDDTRTYE